MKKIFFSLAVMAIAATAAQAQSLSDLRLGILVESEEPANRQELAALNWIKAECPEAVVYTPATISTISTDDVHALWVHVDRIGLDAGWQKLPEAFSNETTVAALRKYYDTGGCLYFTKHATQLATAIGLIDKEANCFGSGEGGDGKDNWTAQAVIGAGMDEKFDNREHRIFEFMEECLDFGHPSFPLLGTGDPETSMWREDHNCFWIPADLGFGAGNGDVNCVRNFQNEYNCTVLATWGHVADYCGAAIIDFNGQVITNGLAAYELAPRDGGNAYTDNVDRLTANSLRYLAKNCKTGVETISATEAQAPVYFNLQGMQVANPAAGQVYIVKSGKDVKKVVM